MSEGKLTRGISLLHAVMILLGYIIGASIFLLIGPLAGEAGPALYFSYLIAAVPAVFVCLYNVQLGAVMPVTAANYIVSTRVISPFAGFLLNWTMLVAIFFGAPLLAWGFAQYLSFFIPEIPVMASALGMLFLLALVNYLGLKPAVWTQTLLVALFIAALAIFVFGGLPHVDPQLQTPLFPLGFGAVLFMAIPAYYSYIGFTVITEVAGEIKNPRKNIPLALVISIAAVLVVYGLTTYVLTGTLHWEQAAASPAAVSEAAAGFLPAALVTFIGIAALFAAATTVNGILLTSSRDIMMLGRDGVLPEIFGRIDARFGTPSVAIWFIFLLSAVGVLLAMAIEKYALLTVFGLMVIHIIAATAVFKLPRKLPELYQRARLKFSPFWRWFAWLGALIAALFFLATGMMFDLNGALLFVVLVLLGIPYWFIRKRYLAGKKIDLEENMRNFSGMLEDELKVE